MTYKVEREIESETTEDQRHVVQLIKVSRPHVAIDFAKEQYTDVDLFRFESGYVTLEGAKVEITRLLISCEKGHDHGVYYQAPRELSLFETMFAVGELEEVKK